MAGRKKGTPKTGGRRKGTPNRATLEAKAACAEIVDNPAYRANLARRARSGKLAPAVETMLWYFAKGKPKETIEHQDNRDLGRMSDDELKAEAIKLAGRLLQDDDVREHIREQLKD